MSALRAGLLERILTPGALSVAFQPILERTGAGWELHALEALTRGPRGTNVESACVLFEYAREKLAERRVDEAALRLALAGAAGIPGWQRLSLNLHASSLCAGDGLPDLLASLARDSSIDPARLIVEVIEYGPAWDLGAFRRGLDALRGHGMRIALDDVGRGHSNYRMLLDVAPDYIKIDQCIVHGCDHDPRRRAVIESLSYLARKLDCEVVAEGIESAGELVAVLDAGVRHVQGHLFEQRLGRAALLDSPWLAGGEAVTAALARLR